MPTGSIGGAAPSVHAADSAPSGMNATTLSVFRMAGDIGCVAGPPALGALAQAFGAAMSLAVAPALPVAAEALFALLALGTYRERVR